jgi:hypothetical protein
MIGHSPNCFEEIYREFGEGEELNGRGSGDVPCGGGVGCGEEVFVERLWDEVGMVNEICAQDVFQWLK